MSAPSINSTNVLWCKLNLIAQGRTGGVVTEFNMLQGANYGWDTSENAIRSSSGSAGTSNFCGFRLVAAYEAGGAGDGEGTPPASAVDGSSAAGGGKRLFYAHVYSSSGSGLAAVDPVGTTGYGDIFFLVDSSYANAARNCRGWCAGGSDSIPVFMSAHPMSFICVDAEWTGTEVAVGSSADKLKHIDVVTSGYEFDPTDIVSAAFGYTGGQLYSGTMNRFGYYDAYTAIAGEVGDPGTFQHFKDQAQSEKHYAFCQGDGAQWRCRMAIEFGDADLGDAATTYFDDANGSISFGTRPESLTSPLARPFHGPDNKLGMELALRSVDVFRLTNYQLSSGTPWHLRFASNVGATAEFINCVIQNAGGTDDDCEIDADVLISGGLIDQCGTLSVNGGKIENCTITNPANGAAIDITETSDLSNLDFAVVRDDTALAIEIPDPAGGTDNYSFDNFTFDGFNFDVRVLGSTGTVNINIVDGDIPVVSSGTVTSDTPALLDTWTDGTSKTAGSSGSGKRAVFVVVSSDGSKLPDGVTFGGEDMTAVVSNLQDVIGLSLWMIDESSSPAVFTGSQTVAASWTGGTPSNVTFQSATYNNIRTVSNQAFITDTHSNSAGSSSSVANLNDWQSTNEVNSITMAVSAGSGRYLIGIVNHEDNGSGGGPTGATYGDKPMTLLVEESAAQQTSQIWGLKEADIAAAIGTTFSTSGSSGDTPSLGLASFTGVNQSAPLKDSATGTSVNPSTGAVLTADDGDMIIGSFASTGGSSLSAWGGIIATPDSTFAENTGDDPSHGAYKAYSAGDTTTGTVSATGGNNPRTRLCAAVIAGAESLTGALVTSLDDVGDEYLCIAASQIHATVSLWGITFGGDVTERDEVDRTDQRVAVADYIESAGPATVDATMTSTSTDVGDDSQLIVASIRPSFSISGGPTVNVSAVALLELTNLVPNSEVRAYVGTDPQTSVEIDGVENSGTSFEFSQDEAGNEGYIQIHAINYESITLPLTYSASAQSIPIQQRFDRNYLNP